METIETKTLKTIQQIIKESNKEGEKRIVITKNMLASVLESNEISDVWDLRSCSNSEHIIISASDLKFSITNLILEGNSKLKSLLIIKNDLCLNNMNINVSGCSKLSSMIINAMAAANLAGECKDLIGWEDTQLIPESQHELLKKYILKKKLLKQEIEEKKIILEERVEKSAI